MASEYDALLEAPSEKQKSEYDALFSEPSASKSKTSGVGAFVRGLDLTTIPRDVGGTLAQIAFPEVEAFHAIKQAGQVLTGTPVAEAIPESQKLVGIEQKPIEERIKAGFDIATQLALAKGATEARPTLEETAFGKSPEALPTEIPYTPVLTEQTAAEITPKEVIPSAIEERKVTEGGVTEHPGDVEGGTPTETGYRGGVESSAEIGEAVVPAEQPIEPITEATAQPETEAPLVTAPAEASATVEAPEVPSETPTGGVSAAAMAERPIETPPLGEVIGWEQNTENGHAWLDAGGDPATIIQKFQETGAVTPPEMGQMRASLERLQAATNVAGDALRKDPGNPELENAYQNALGQEQDFSNAYKPMHTFASANLASLQGRVPLTEESAQSFTGMHRDFQENFGREFTPEESSKADTLVNKNAEAARQVETNNTNLLDTIDKELEKVPSKVSGRRTPTFQELGEMFSEKLKEVCDL